MNCSAPSLGSDQATLPLADAPPSNRGGRVDLCVRNARLVVTMDAERREIPGGWVAVEEMLGRHRRIAGEWLSAATG